MNIYIYVHICTMHAAFLYYIGMDVTCVPTKMLQSFAGPVTWSDLAPCATFQDVFRPCVDESAMDQLATADL